MDTKDASNQIAQMISFIESEAKDREREIFKKAEEEYSIEKHNIVRDEKEKIRSQHEIKLKKAETQRAIKRSKDINASRLKKIEERQRHLDKIQGDAREQLKRQSSQPDFIVKLIVQGLVMLLEDNVYIRCRKADQAVVQSCLPKAAAQYRDLIKKQSGADKSVTLQIDSEVLRADCMGGIVLSCFNSKITIDNTIDTRLKLVMEQAKPAIRDKLFGQ